MTRVYIETIGLDVDPDKRIVYLADGGERKLTGREYQALKAQIQGATSLAEIARSMSDDDVHTGRGVEGAADTVDAGSAAKHLETLRSKLGAQIVPILKRGRKK